MAQVGRTTTKKVLHLLSAATGLPYSAGAIALREQCELPAIDPGRITARNVSPEIAERATGALYPAVHVYCEGIENLLREKFRTVSGKAHMAIEVRVSLDRLDDLEGQLQMYTEAVTEILDSHRGDWGEGMFYTGGWTVRFGAAKHGGKNFVQTAKITFDVEVSAN